VAAPIQPAQLALHLQTNWESLAPVATGQVRIPGLAVQAPTADAVAALPAVVRQAVADATPAGTELVVTKYVEAVDGKVSTLIDDATAPSLSAVHLVVNTVSLAGGAASATTYQVVAEPRPHVVPRPITPVTRPPVVGR